MSTKSVTIDVISDDRAIAISTDDMDATVGVRVGVEGVCVCIIGMGLGK